MDLSIITVTWNSENKIGNQIESVRDACSGLEFEEIVIDNNSADNTVNLIKEKYPSVKLIVNKDNAGFAKANNQGAKISTGNFLLFLNPDMKLESGGLKKIIDWIKQKPEVGLVSCKLVDEQGKNNLEASPRRFPTVLNQLVIVLKLNHLFPSLLNNYLYTGFDFDKEQEVESVRGSFMLMPRAIYEKLGYAFDEYYYFWFEDVDICRSIKKLGYKIIYTPIINCVDYVGESFKKRPSLWKQKQFTKSMLLYFQKWDSWYRWIWIWLFRPVGIFYVWVLNLFK